MKDEFSLYSKKVMQYFAKPKNIGIIKNADGIGTVGNPKCGDVMKVYIKVAERLKPSAISHQLSASNLKNPKSQKAASCKLKAESYIKDIKVQTLGCGAAIATSSMMTEMAKGKTIKEALKITNREVTQKLGGLPKAKLHCSVLAEQGIREAIKDYQNKNESKTKK